MKNEDYDLNEICARCGKVTSHDDGLHDHVKDIWVCADCADEYWEKNKNNLEAE